MDIVGRYVLKRKWPKYFVKVLSHLFSDAASDDRWLSIVYGLKDRNLKNLLVFSQKIDDLTIFFIVALRTEGKEEKTALSGPDSPCLQR